MSVDGQSLDTYECQECGDTFGTERGRDSHVEQVHGRPYHDADLLRDLYVEQGLSSLEIADRFDVSDKTIRNTLRREGIQVRSTQESHLLKAPDVLRDGDRLRELYVDEGLPIEKVAAEIGHTYHRTRNWLRRHGIEFREGVLRGEDHPLWVEDAESIYYGENWDRQRARARARDDNTCQICGHSPPPDGWNLDVHHIQPVETFDEPEDGNHLWNLITLCRSCHRRWEGIPLRPEVESA